MIRKSGNPNDLNDPNSKCLSNKFRQLNNKISKKLVILPCKNATRYYLDNNRFDKDYEIHVRENNGVIKVEVKDK